MYALDVQEGYQSGELGFVLWISWPSKSDTSYQAALELGAREHKAAVNMEDTIVTKKKKKKEVFF